MTPSFVMSTFGLGAFAVAILIAAPFFGGIQDSLPAVVIAMAGLVLVASALIGWVSAGWVRLAIERKRLAGSSAWPIRIESAGLRWIRVGTLEADQVGLTITVKHRAIKAAWTDLAVVEISDGGIFKGKSIVLDGPRSGRVELEVLQLNAVAREGDEGFQEVFSALETLKSEAREEHGRTTVQP
jgi:hypothetical protein